MKTSLKLIIISVLLMFTVCSKKDEVSKKPELVHGNFIWHWHKHTYFNKKDIKQLKDLGIKGMFFDMGNFSYYKEAPQFDFLNFNTGTFRRLKALNLLQTHLVFTFSNSTRFPFVEYFNSNNKKAVSFVINEIESCLNIFQCMGVEISGIQLDMEGKVSFKKYKRLIDTIADKFGEEYLLSICTQVYWQKRKDFRALIENTDFIVPMIYDYAIGKRANHLMKVTNSKWIEKIVKEYGDTNKPFYAGIPSYSYSKIYDYKGKRVDLWAKLSPEEISENPDLKLTKSKAVWSKESKKYLGDNDYVFMAIRDTELANYELKKGAGVKFNMLNPEAVQNYILTVEKVSPPNMMGISIFRFGYRWEDLIVNIEGIKEAFNLKRPRGCLPEIDVLIDRSRYTENSKGSTVSLNFVLRNSGDKSSFLSESANKLRVSITGGDILSCNRGGFDTAERNCDIIFYRETHLEANEEVYSGLLTVRIELFPLLLEASSSSLQQDGKTEYMSDSIIIEIYPDKVVIN